MTSEGAKKPPPVPANLEKVKLLFDGAEDKKISPGSLFGRRVAVLAEESESSSLLVFAATGRELFHAFVPRGEARVLSRGKEGVCIPAVSESPVSALSIEPMQHIAEVQSITAVDAGDTAVIASMDSLGRASVMQIEAPCGGIRGQGRPSLAPLATYQLMPAAPIREPGWAGVAVSGCEPGTVATAHYFSRCLTVYEGQILLRTLGLHGCPTSLCFLPPSFPGCSSGAVVAAALGSEVAVWDVRVAGQAALVAQLSLGGSTERLYDVTCAPGDSAVIGAAGADRAVGIWEPRKWAAVSRWNNCLKYEVHHLHFSTINPEYCYVAGADYEVLCGSWGSMQRKGGGARTGKGTGHRPRASSPEPDSSGIQSPMAFRGDARWLGIARAPSAEILAGFSSSGHLFLATMQQ